MRFAAVVCTRDRPEQLARSLTSLAANLRATDERVVVDSASVDAAAVAAVAADAGFRLVRVEQPGLSRARNAALDALDVDIVAFTDDDCTVDPGWSAAIEAAFADPTVAFAAGPVLADRQTKLPLAVDPSTEPRRFSGDDDPTTVGHGANMAFRREAIVAAGAFDVDLGAGARLRAAEDTDAFWRLLRDGWTGVFVPEAKVTHAQWRTTREALRTSYGYGMGVGAMARRGVAREQRGAWGVLGHGLWRDGVVRGARDLRAGYQTGALSSWLRAVGVAVGAVRAGRPRR